MVGGGVLNLGQPVRSGGLRSLEEPQGPRPGWLQLGEAPTSLCVLILSESCWALGFWDWVWPKPWMAVLADVENPGVRCMFVALYLYLYFHTCRL